MKKKRGLYLLLAAMIISISTNSLMFETAYADDLQIEKENLDVEELSNESTQLEDTEFIDNTIQEEVIIDEPIEQAEVIPQEQTEEPTVTESVYQVQTVSIITFTDRVFNRITNEGLANVDITATHKETGESYSTFSDDNGYFTLELYPGEYDFLLRKNGFKDIQVNIIIEDINEVQGE